MKGQETLSFHTWHKLWAQRGWAGCPSNGRNQNSRPGSSPHQAWEKPTWKKTKSSPIFHLYIFIFLVMELSISQGKIWVKIHSPDFQYITFLTRFMVVFSFGWNKCCWIIRLCLHFLLSQQHHFNPAGQSVLGISFCHLTPVCPHNFPFNFFCISVFPLFWVTCFLPKWLFV